MNAWHKWRALTWTQRGWLVKGTLLVVAFRVALWVLPFRTVLAFVDRVPRGRRALPPDEAVRMVRAAARRLLGDRPCLPQALAVRYWLKRAGRDSTLRIGVMKDAGGALKAHAWLELDGRVLIGGESSRQRYVSLQPVAPATET
ncbi:MAG: hypothetical protein KatS3mg042_0615 [Rhodothermaceae bacterium]|nr:MAG: hypothetical protein KatS3mg042_0615 [Rhodothermaceae bacterium]